MKLLFLSVLVLFGSLARADEAVRVPPEKALEAFKADAAVKKALGTLTGKEEYDATLLTDGGELPPGAHRPYYFTSYLVVARQPEYTPHGFHHKNVIGRVNFQNDMAPWVKLVKLSELP